MNREWNEIEIIDISDETYEEYKDDMDALVRDEFNFQEECAYYIVSKEIAIVRRDESHFK
ncbi:MAG: hypothetical protein KBT32_04995 [Bacteroidales bacterium]|nr:hypothetical protein [Candidatus Physcocola equi]